MKVKVLKPQNTKENYRKEPKILTANYLKQINEKNSYNVIERENRREVGKKLTIKKCR